MSRTIDERIVSMSFDNKNFEKNVSQSIGTLDKLKSALDFTKADSSLKDISKTASAFNLNGISESITKVQEKFSALEVAGITALVNITNKAVNAGLQIAKSLTLDQPIQGFQKYTEKTSSVQTLMNSTGKSVDQVNDYLDRLMWYADETSFGFTDMTSALSTMVSSGGDIEKLIPMIMGMGNAVAYAGKGASEFSRVIYNLNQSYSLGYLSTMDWRSVQMAGASSKQLQQYLIAAAEQVGTIEKGTGDLSKFSSYLTDKAITSEAMEIAFENFAQYTLAVEEAVNNGTYANATEAMEHMAIDGFDQVAVKAMEAAQNYKSFSEAVDASKDAASTAWMKIFESVFGDYEQAKSLWTRVGTDIFDLFVSPLDGAVDKAEEWASMWKQLQSRDYQGRNSDLAEYASQTEAVYAALSDTVRTFIDNIVGFWNEGALEISAQQIFNAIEKFRSGLKSLNEYLGSDSFSEFYKIFSGISSVLATIAKIGKTIVTSFVVPLVKSFKPVVDQIAGILGDIGDSLYYGSGIIDEMGLPSLENVLSKIVSGLQPLINLLATVFEHIRKITSSIKDKIYESWSKDVDDSTESFSLLSTVLDTISKVIDKVTEGFKGFSSIISTIVDICKKAVSALGGLFDSLKKVASSFLNDNGTSIGKVAGGGILAAIGINLASAIKGLKDMNIEKVVSSLNIKNFLSNGLNTLLELPKKLGEVFGSLNDAISKFTNVQMIQTISKSLLILAAALLVMSSIDSDKIGQALGTVATVLLELMGTITILNKINPGKSLSTATKAIQTMSTSLLVISAALKILSGIDVEGLQNGVLSLGVMLTLMAAALGILAAIQENSKSFNGKGLKQAASSMTSMATALLIMSAALKILSGESTGDMTIAVVSLSAVLAALVVAANYMSNNKKAMATFSASVALIGPALVLVSAALKILATMELTEALISVGTLGVFFTELVVAAKAISNNKKAMATFAASVALISPALLLTSAALKILSTMDLAGAAIAVVSLGIVLAEIAGFGLLIGKIASIDFAIVSASMILMATALIGVAAAMKILGTMSWSEIGTALGSMALSLVTLGTLGTLLGIVSPLLIAGAAAMALFGTALVVLAKGLLSSVEAVIAWNAVSTIFSSSFLEMMSSVTAAVVEVIPGIIVGLAKAITESAGAILEIFTQLIAIMCNAIVVNVPTLAATALAVLVAILQTIRDNLEQVITLVGEIIVTFITALDDQIINVVTAAVEFLINVINGLAETIRNESADIGAAIGNLISALLEGIIKALGNGIISFGSHIAQAGKDFLSWLTGGMTDDEAIETQTQTGQTIVDNVTTGMESKRESIVQEGKTLSTDTVAALNNADGAFGSGQSMSSGYSSGILDKKGDVDSAVNQVSVDTVAGLDKTKDVQTSGQSVMTGYNSVIVGNTPLINKSINTIGTDVVTGLNVEDGAEESGNDTIEAFHTEISDEEEPINITITDIMSNLTDRMDASDDAESSGLNTMNGLLSGLTNSSKLTELYNAGWNAASSYMSGYNTRMDQHSPSREMMRQAKFTIMGLVNGFANNLSLVKKSGESVGSAALNAVKDALSASANLDESQLNPVITPVLDLSQLESESSKISGLLNTNPNVTALGTVFGQNGGTSSTNNVSINVEFNVDKVGGNLTDADILRYSNQIADQVNQKLGELL